MYICKSLNTYVVNNIDIHILNKSFGVLHWQKKTADPPVCV